MSLLEHEAQTLASFKSNIEDLALEELSRLETERVALDEALASVRESIKSVRAVLSAARPPQAKKKKEPSKAGAPFKLSEEREVEVIRWLTGNTDEITSRTARAQFPNWSASYVNMVLKHMREQSLLRLAATSGGMNVYRSLL